MRANLQRDEEERKLGYYDRVVRELEKRLQGREKQEKTAVSSRPGANSTIDGDLERLFIIVHEMGGREVEEQQERSFLDPWFHPQNSPSTAPFHVENLRQVGLHKKPKQEQAKSLKLRHVSVP